MTNSNPLLEFVIVAVMTTVAFYLQEMPNSNVLQMVLPEWPYILMLYFSVSTRYYFGVISAFTVGVIQDVFLGIPTLGLHAGIYVISSFILITSRLRFKHLTLASQSMSIGLLVLFKIILVTIYSGVFYSTPTHFWSLLSVPLSVLLWPLLYLFFQFFASKRTE